MSRELCGPLPSCATAVAISCTPAGMCMRMYACHEDICLCIHVCMCVQLYIYIYIHVYVYAEISKSTSERLCVTRKFHTPRDITCYAKTCIHTRKYSRACIWDIDRYVYTYMHVTSPYIALCLEAPAAWDPRTLSCWDLPGNEETWCISAFDVHTQIQHK